MIVSFAVAMSDVSPWSFSASFTDFSGALPKRFIQAFPVAAIVIFFSSRNNDKLVKNLSITMW